MVYISNPTETRKIIDLFGFSFKKKYGQNFLIDRNIVEKIVNDAGVTKDDTVLEIGPGIGTMTQVLSEKAGRVVAVEIDSKLIDILKMTLSDCENTDVIEGDILKTDIKKLSERYGVDKFKVVANLPYYITTPIIMKLMSEFRENISSITVMVQKEVADRLCASPGNKNYGSITLAVNYYSCPEVIVDVAASCFMPRPNVDSVVVKMGLYKDLPVKSLDDELMFKIIKSSFLGRRKTLANCLASGIGLEKEMTKKFLAELGLREDIRGENLSLEQFAELTNKITVAF